jgi:hypothetical protein
MTTSYDDLFLSILSMDVYNRGGFGLNLGLSPVGDATLGQNSNAAIADHEDTGFLRRFTHAPAKRLSRFKEPIHAAAEVSAVGE